MNKIIKIISYVILSISKATLNVFVYFLGITLSVGILFELFQINLAEYVKLMILVFLPIVFINDFINNFKLLYNSQQTKPEFTIGDASNALEDKEHSFIRDKTVEIKSITKQEKKEEVSKPQEIPISGDYLDWMGGQIG